ncbi:MAG: pyridoxamine 5'-phosphate oxidase family protein [Bacilli bacterium]|nr:pyridoxamine 5'-phosphate oxidase family protein [Bacilli bacterium]
MNNYIYEKMDTDEINNILNECTICVLGTSNYDYPYLVPMYFIYEYKNNNYLFILESKCMGRKIKNILNNNKVCIFIQYNDTDCYKSIIANGIANINKLHNTKRTNMVSINITIDEIEGRAYYK